MKSFIKSLLPKPVLEFLRERRRLYSNQRYLKQGFTKIKCGTYEIEAPNKHILTEILKSQPYRDLCIGITAKYISAKYPNGTIIDIGSNIGDTAALIATYARNKLILIEDKLIFGVLQKIDKALLKKSKLMKLPNFIIIGAPKAGTTSFFNYLRQHPQIYMSSYKEPAYFAPEVFERRKKEYEGRKKFRFGAKTPLYGEAETTPLSFEEYCALFQSVENETAVGEASTCYLSELKTPERIKQFLPNVKLIAILRDPVERAYSDYCYNYRDDVEERSFSKVLQEDPKHYYFTRGFYYLHLKRYFDIFQASQIKICFQEDLNTSPLFVIQDIFKFLSVDYTYELQDLHKSNVSGIPKSRLIHNFVFGINPVKSTLKHFFSEKVRQNLYLTISKYNLSPKPTLSLELRQRLIDIYREDILKLQKLIDKDLSHWLDAN